MAIQIKEELLRLNYTDITVNWVFPTNARASVFKVKLRDFSGQFKYYQVMVYPDFFGNPKSIFWEGENPPVIEVNAISKPKNPFMEWLDKKFPPN